MIWNIDRKIKIKFRVRWNDATVWQRSKHKIRNFKIFGWVEIGIVRPQWRDHGYTLKVKTLSPTTQVDPPVSTDPMSSLSSLPRPLKRHNWRTTLSSALLFYFQHNAVSFFIRTGYASLSIHLLLDAPPTTHYCPRTFQFFVWTLRDSSLSLKFRMGPPLTHHLGWDLWI